MPLTTPTISLSKLASLKGKEKRFYVIWGATRWLALALTVLTAAFLIDWTIDKTRDTPMWLRLSLSLLQGLVVAAAGYFWLLRPLVVGPSMIRLARRVEQEIPEFDHRLITAIQLTQKNAQVQGMSPQLIEMVSSESEKIAGKYDFTNLADARRLKWSAALAAWPIALLMFQLVFFGPSLLIVLFQRQLLANVPIPRDMAMATVTKANPWPAGDEVTVRYDATSKKGGLSKELEGTVLYTNAATGERKEAKLIWDPETEFTPDRAIFKAVVPLYSTNFTYRAFLGDTRTAGEDRVVFEARPQITIDKVRIQAPAYIPDRPVVELSGKNITAYEGSRARVRITVQKPITEANLNLYYEVPKAKESKDESQYVTRTLAMAIGEPEQVESDNGQKETVYPAESDYFDLTIVPDFPLLSNYRVAVKDQHGWESENNPKGNIKITQPELPYVRLLPERFTLPGEVSTAEDFFLGNLPLPIGKPIRVEYYFRSNIGAREKFQDANGVQYPAYFVYRINDEPETRLPLNEVPETPESGPYDIMNARFANLEYQRNVLKNRIEFTASSAREPGAPSRLEGGGRFDFETANLRKKGPNGELQELEIGDHITFSVQVYDRDPAAGRRPGESNFGVKDIRSAAEVLEAIQRTLQTEQQIQGLQTRQQGVFGKPAKK